MTGWRGVELDAARRTIRLTTAGMRLDLGGIAKGYILQAALEELRRLSIRAAMFEAGGDIAAADPPPGAAGWRIAKRSSEVVSTETTSELLSNSSLATSGPSAQFVEIDGVRYSHVIDPRTGWALTSPLTAHVIDADGATADALATAATVIGPKGLYQLRARFPNAKIDLVPK
jgi:thiamine biosynthesis lipoprotein